MKVAEWKRFADAVRETSGRETRSVVEDLIKNSNSEEVYYSTRFLIIGRERFEEPERNLGVGKKTIRKAVADITQVTYEDIRQMEKEEGKLSLALGRLLEETEQQSLVSQDTESKSLEEVHNKLKSISDMGSESAKKGIIQELFRESPDDEAMWISFFLAGDLAMGIGPKTILKAIANYNTVNHEELRKTYNLEPDVGRIAQDIQKKGGLPEYTPLNNRFKPMLASDADIPEDESNLVFEPKFDGARIIIKQKDGELRAFTRNRQEITDNIPELHEWDWPDEDFVVDGEIIGYEPDTGDYLSYQDTMTRVRREKNIEEAREKVPVTFKLFDLIVWKGEDISECTLDARYNKLHHNFGGVVRRLSSVAYVAFEMSIERGHEGIIAKKRTHMYQFGERTKSWIKEKPVKEPVDLEVVGVEKEQKADSDAVGALTLATREGVNVGQVGTGFTDVDAERLWEIHQNGNLIGNIVEVEWEELQETDNGYGIRFARYITLREEKGEADTLERMEKL